MPFRCSCLMLMCLVAEGKKGEASKVYWIDQLEQSMDTSNIGSEKSGGQHQFRPCDGIPSWISKESHDEQSSIQQQCGNSITRSHPFDAREAPEGNGHRKGGKVSRHRGGGHEGGKVQEHLRLALPSHLCGGQGVPQVGAFTHQKSSGMKRLEDIEGVSLPVLQDLKELGRAVPTCWKWQRNGATATWVWVFST